MSRLVPLLPLLLPLLVLGGEPPQAELGVHGHATLEQESLRGVADEKIQSELMVRSVSSEDVANQTWPVLLNFTDSASETLLASMAIGHTVSVDLANTKCQGQVEDGKCCVPGKGSGKCVPARIVADMETAINFPLIGEMTSSASSKGDNGSYELTLSIKFTGLTVNTTGLELTAAEIVLTVTTRGDTRADYWNLTQATLSLTGSLNGTALPELSDITPKSGYSGLYPACTAPYSPCAPSGLSWSCTDQVFAPTPAMVTKNGLGNRTMMAHIPGLVLQLGNSTTEQYNWDCDPLIPISVLVSVLVSLFLASILMWGICMLATLQTPTKFDDPKGPSIHVPTAE